MTFRPRPLPYAAALAAILLWVAFFLAPAFPRGRALLGVDLLHRFPPWDATVSEDWEAENHLLFDQAAQFYPWRHLARQLQSAGLPPLWNPHAGAGSPLLANEQSATLAPVELLVSGIDSPRATVVAALIRLLVAGGGMILLGRALGLGPSAALFAALAFLGSGSIALLLYHPNANVSMWLPLAAFLSWHLSVAGGPPAAALLAFVLGAQLLGGHPETSLYVSLASVLFFVLGRGAALAEREGGRRLASWLLLIAAHVAGMALAAPQTLPFLEYLREGAVLYHRSGERFFNPPICATGIFVPELFGTPDRPNTYFGPRNYHAMATQYAGLATAFLALAAVVMSFGARANQHLSRQRFLVLALGVTALLCLFLIYPTPVWWLAGLFPPFRVAAHVTGLTLLFSLTLSLLGALGLSALAAGGRTPPRFIAGGLAVAAGLALAAGLLLPLAREQLLAIGAEKLAARYAGVTHAKSLDYYVDRLPLVFAALRSNLVRTGLLGLALAALLGPGAGRAARGSSFAHLLAFAFILHLALDLGHFGRGYVPAIPDTQVFPTTPEIERLRSLPGIARILPTGRALPPNTPTAYGLEDFRLHDAVGSLAHSRFEAAMSSAPFLRRPLASYDRPLLDVAGVSVVVTERSEKIAHPDSAGFTILEQAAVDLLRNDRAWPRAFFCTEARAAAGDAEAIASARILAADPERAPGPPAQVFLTPARTGQGVASPRSWEIVRRLHPEVDASAPKYLTRHSPVFAAREDSVIEIGELTHSPLVVTAAITAPVDGWLVLLDQDFPGWDVRVSGVPGRTGRAYGLFRAVAVPAGAHTVIWRYRPASYAEGLEWAAGALAAIALGLALNGIRRLRA